MIGVKRNKTRPGFTMAEVLIVLATFSVIVTLVSDIYARTGIFGRQIVVRAKLQADARNALEAIARAVRVSNLDYASAGWGGTLPAQPMTELRLINPNTSDVSRIRSDATQANCYNDANSTPCLTVSTDGGSNWAPLSTKGSIIDKLYFYASPSKDPFKFNSSTGQYDSDSVPTPTDQPEVTIVLQMHNYAPRASDQWVFTLQTTVTPRLYLR